MLAFWKHGLKGKSFHSDEVISYKFCQTATELLPHVFSSCQIHICAVCTKKKGKFYLYLQVTQEITDESRVFRVLGINRYVNANLTICISHMGMGGTNSSDSGLQTLHIHDKSLPLFTQ